MDTGTLSHVSNRTLDLLYVRRDMLHRLFWSLRLNGVAGPLTGILVRLRKRLLRKTGYDGFVLARDVHFDRHLRVDTTAHESYKAPDIPADVKSVVFDYEPLPAVDVALAVEHVVENIPPGEAEQTTFVDVGCGKGRVLLIASLFPFRHVRGIEISPSLASVAERNATDFRGRQRCRDVSVVTENAVHADLPAGPMVIYLFNPFPRAVVEEFVARLEDSLLADPRPATVMYANPLHVSVFKDSPVWDRQPYQNPYWAVFRSTDRPSAAPKPR